VHWYKFNIADYRKDTAHLSMLEHGIYRTLIDWYYLDEKPIPKETQSVMRRLSLGIEDLQSLQNVLKDFFILNESGYFHKRINSEILDYSCNATKNVANGKLGGRPKKTQSVILGNPNETKVKGNQEPLTINQEPLTKEEKRLAQRATRLPVDWQPDGKLLQWAKDERPDLDGQKTVERFRDYWIAKPGKDGLKINWDATYRNWIRSERPGVGGGQTGRRSFREIDQDEAARRVAEISPRIAAKTSEQRAESQRIGHGYTIDQ
jgi:uncharacterized protein YdaU (DUF1376 family)